MPLAKKADFFSAEDYLEWEKGNEIKHEYLDGEVYPMDSAKDAHVTVAGNISVLLKNHLRGGPCRVYMAGMKVRVEAANQLFYPDVLVTCDPADRSADYFKSHPALIVEVLSESTSAYDRGKKFEFYRQLDSLREYVLVDPDRFSVDCFRRDATGHWVLYPFGAGETVELAGVDLRAPIEAFYEDVTFPEKPARRG
ncbi:MAG: Uma2 family endonuclease [Sulfuricellaceae bacterium]